MASGYHIGQSISRVNVKQIDMDIGKLPGEISKGKVREGNFWKKAKENKKDGVHIQVMEKKEGQG